jgi:ankyrin repeat protein
VSESNQEYPTMTNEPPSAAWARYQQTMAAPSNLWTAAKANDVAELTRLLDAGHPIDDRDHRGYSPLMLAAYAGHGEAFDLLLSRGADPNTADLAGNTVLMGAAFRGFLPIVAALLAAGADATAINHGGLDARGFARNFGRAEVLELLVQHAERTRQRLTLTSALPARTQAPA